MENPTMQSGAPKIVKTTLPIVLNPSKAGLYYVKCGKQPKKKQSLGK